MDPKLKVDESQKKKPEFRLGQEVLDAYEPEEGKKETKSKSGQHNKHEAHLKPVKSIDRPLVERYPEVADDDDETLLADVRRHWLGRLAILLTGGFTVFLLLAIAVSITTLSNKSGLEITSGLKSVTSLVLFLVAILVGIGTYIAYWVYNHSRLLITDQNVIELKQISLFAHRTSHLNMINVEDVTVTKHGILQTVLDYGTLQIETAGEKDNFEFVNTPNPDTYRRMVINAHERAIEHVGTMGASQRVEIIKNGF